ncbi:MAG: C39 family peptidase [Planctomycetota bacterium]
MKSGAGLLLCALGLACSSGSGRGAVSEYRPPDLARLQSALEIAPGFELGSREIPWAMGIDPIVFGDGRAISFEDPAQKEDEYTSPVFDCAPFDECLVSWNARHSKATGFGVEISVARAADQTFSPWMWIGEWNVSARPKELALEFEDAKIDVDTFTSRSTWSAVRLRVRVRASESGQLRFALERLSIVPTLRAEHAVSIASTGKTLAISARLAVPFRSQRVEAPALASRICSPTSLSMVLAYRGVDVPTSEVARRAYDPFHDIYGNWNRAIQTACSFGVPGRLERIHDWHRAEELLAKGQPLILSIAAKAGQLHGAPYASTAGHLLVLCGFDEASRALVNDPAADTASAGQTAYSRDDLETVWMKRGGTAYVLEASHRP